MDDRTQRYSLSDDTVSPLTIFYSPPPAQIIAMKTVYLPNTNDVSSCIWIYTQLLQLTVRCYHCRAFKYVWAASATFEGMHDQTFGVKRKMHMNHSGVSQEKL